jgi:hypothetical protein
MKSGYLSPGNSLSLNLILALKIFRDKIIANGGKKLVFDILLAPFYHTDRRVGYC